MNEKNEHRDIFTWLISLILAIPGVTLTWLSVKVLWPVLRFAGKKVWAMLKKRFAKSTAPAPEKTSLPTPKIFEGAKNLAPARPFKL